MSRIPKKRRPVRRPQEALQGRLDSTSSIDEADDVSPKSELRKRRPGKLSGAGGNGEPDAPPQMVWRAVFFGAAVALVLVMVPSYLVVPRLGKTRMVAVGVGEGGTPRVVGSTELPIFSAGIAPGSEPGRVVVAVPREDRIIEYKLVDASSSSSLPSNTRTDTSESGVHGGPLEEVGSIPVGAGPVAVATSPTRHLLLVGKSRSSEVAVVDLSSGELSRTIAASSRPVAISVLDDYAVAALAGLESDSVTLVDLASLASRDLGVSNSPRHMATMGSLLYVAGDGSRSADVIDVTRGAKSGNVAVDFPIGTLAGCGSMLAAGRADLARVVLFPPEDPSRKIELNPGGHPRVLQCLVDGRLLVGTDSPRGISIVGPGRTERGTAVTQDLFPSLTLSFTPLFAAEVSPGIVAFAGTEPLSTPLASALVASNLLGIFTGGLVTGVVARRRYGAHALVLAAILLGSYWVVFQGAQPAALPAVVIFVGLPLLATCGTGVWVARLIASRIDRRPASGEGNTATSREERDRRE